MIPVCQFLNNVVLVGMVTLYIVKDFVQKFTSSDANHLS